MELRITGANRCEPGGLTAGQNRGTCEGGIISGAEMANYSSSDPARTSVTNISYDSRSAGHMKQCDHGALGFIPQPNSYRRGL